MLTKKQLLWLMVSFCLGAIVLSVLSVFQKAALGADPFTPIGFIIPVLFGGVSGAIVGIYIVKVRGLNAKLQQRVNTLESFLPICSNCKRIRKPDSDPKKIDSWEQLESYISRKTSSQFSHGICPECMKKLYGDNLNKDH